MLAITENLLQEPNNPKFQRFKPTNSVIKRDLVDPKGALEFAIEVRFSFETSPLKILPNLQTPFSLGSEEKSAIQFFSVSFLLISHNQKVQNFQPYYTFNQRHMEDLRIGNSILKDYIDLETEKEERAARAKKNEKASIEAAAKKVDICDFMPRSSMAHTDTTSG